MSFGFGISDFVTAIQLTNQLRRRFIHSPGHFKAITDEIKGLSNVLRDLDDLSLERDISDQQKADLSDYSKSCQAVLKELNRITDKYHELDSNGKSLGAKSKRLWKRIKWEPEDVALLRTRITSNITLLTAFYGSLNHQVVSDIKTGVERLNKSYDDANRQAFLDWLSPLDFANQQSDIIRRRTEGTWIWLLESDEFKEWFDGSSRTLFCTGMPGAGKTMNTAIVIDHLTASSANDVGVAYVYCNYNRAQEQTLENILASLLQQLLQGRPLLDDKIAGLHERYSKKTRPLIGELIASILSISISFARIHIIVDALDECSNTDGIRNRLLDELLRLQAQTSFNLFATSRFDMETQRKLQNDLRLEIRASEEDVRNYIEKEIIHKPQLWKCVQRKTELLEKIKVEIVQAVEGMFLLADLHLDSLRDKTTPKAIQSALRELPRGSAVYADTYERALSRIDNQDPGLRQLARDVIGWLVYAERELQTVELQHALAVEIGESSLDEDNIPDLTAIMDVCAGLVRIDEDKDVIRLVHYTTQEYFRRVCMSWEPHPPTEITRVCLAYLAFDRFASGRATEDTEYDVRCHDNPLLDYAAHHWGTHSRMGKTEAVAEAALELFDDEAKISCASQVLLRRTQYEVKYLPLGLMGPHIASYTGAIGILRLLLDHGHHADTADQSGRTPLSWAAERGRKDVVKFLVERDDVDADSKDSRGQTPLSRAAENGQEDVVRCLVERDDVDADSKDARGQTPLTWAARREQVAVVELLVERDDVDLDAEDEDGRTPLLHAAMCGNAAVTKLLVERDDVESDRKDCGGRTSLSFASQLGHEVVVRVFLERQDIDVNSKDEDGRTPLSWTAGYGREDVVKILLAKDVVDAESRDETGRTPLSWAAGEGHENVVKILLARDDIDTESQDEEGRTPLSWAAGMGQVDVVKILLARDDVDNESLSKNGRTPLSWAAGWGEVDVVKILLARDDVDADSKDHNGRTALCWASSTYAGYEAMELLLARDEVDANSKDRGGRTALSWASSSYTGYKAMKILLARDDVEASLKDHSGRTPLSWASTCEWGYHSVKLLLARDEVKAESKDHSGRTPLSLAAQYGSVDVVEVLLAQRNVEADSKDVSGRTPLSWAASCRDTDVVKLLLAHHNVEADAKDVRGRTPLSWAAGSKWSNEAVIELLLERDDVDINSVDRDGRTALSYAIEAGQTLEDTREDETEARDDVESQRFETEKVVQLLRRHGGQ